MMETKIKISFTLVFFKSHTSFFHNNFTVIYVVTIILSLVSTNLNSRHYIFTEHTIVTQTYFSLQHRTFLSVKIIVLIENKL